jgi:hypothetical protein
VTGRSETEADNPPSGVQVRPLAYTLVACVAVAILTVFSGTGDPGGFSDGLTLPRTWFPPLLLLLMHSVYLLLRRDRIAGFTLAPYLLLAFHDLWWAWALSQLN